MRLKQVPYISLLICFSIRLTILAAPDEDKAFAPYFSDRGVGSKPVEPLEDTRLFVFFTGSINAFSYYRLRHINPLLFGFSRGQ